MESKAPDDIMTELGQRYEAVGQARIAGDLTLAAQRYAELERFCRAQTVATGSSTFLCGLAVITEEDETAIRLFHESLTLARAQGESMQDILFPLAARHYQRGELALARRYADQARQQALANSDTEGANEAASLLEGLDENAT
jgi:hypothetical protein